MSWIVFCYISELPAASMRRPAPAGDRGGRVAAAPDPVREERAAQGRADAEGGLS